MRIRPRQLLYLVAIAAAAAQAEPSDPIRDALPLPAPKWLATRGAVLFKSDFEEKGMDGMTPDRTGVWSVRRGLLRADLPDRKQERSFLYAGSEDWSNYAVDLDVCGMRGVDKGVVVRVVGDKGGIGVDLRGPGYQDVVMNRREWPMGKERVSNANGVWHHVRIEARGNRFRVWVNGALLLDKEDSRNVYPSGRIALAAYTGGVGQCTVYYDNVVVTKLD